MVYLKMSLEDGSIRFQCMYPVLLLFFPENYLLILSDSLQDEFAATTKDPCTSSLAFQPVMPVIPPSTIDVMDDSDLCQESIIIENDIRYGFPKTTADKSSSTLQTGMPVITPILHQLMQWLLHTHVNKLQLKMPFYVHFQHSYHNIMCFQLHLKILCTSSSTFVMSGIPPSPMNFSMTSQEITYDYPILKEETVETLFNNISPSTQTPSLVDIDAPSSQPPE